MNKLKIIALCVVFVGIAAERLAPAAPQDVKPKRVTNQQANRPHGARRDAPPPFTQRADYIVGLLDLIDIEVQEALPGRLISGERIVRPDGRISLFFYGEVFVAGLTVPEIKIKIIRHMQKFLTDETLGLVVLDNDGNPVVDAATGKPKRIDPKDSKAVRVELTQCNSKHFYVEGEVLSPGRFPVTGTQSILDAIKLAGGLSPLADHEKVVLYREGSQGAPVSFTVNVDQIERGTRPSANTQLKSGDRLVVRRRAGEGSSGPKPSQAPSRTVARAAGALPIESRDHAEVANEDASLRHLEHRMAELERKLDRILETVKKPAG